ncbi:MAG: aspartyl/glutamyl-tRNA amidotransferase subunit C [Thaumarchaeota archaeon]|nr:aspartyl/glutamyl-tRNA amidotransferase subunit C [Nitrososphaerota archaeon]
MPPRTKKAERQSPTMSLESVRRLAGLSRLNLTASEEERLLSEFSSILEYFKVLDRSAGPAEDGPTVTPANLRRDEVGPSDGDGVMKGVPRRKGRLVRAPRVF